MDETGDPATTAWNTDVTELDGFRIGDIVRTATGRHDHVITRLERANTVEELDYLRQRADERGHGLLGCAVDVVNHRVLRNGQPFGPLRRSQPSTLTLVERQDGGK